MIIDSENIKDKKDFLAFLSLLIQDYKGNPETWENKTLEEYLEAMAAWVEDSDGYYKNTNQANPENTNWKAFADILIGAKVYE